MPIASTVPIVYVNNNVNRNYRFSFFNITGNTTSNLQIIPDMTNFIINSVNFSFTYSVINQYNNTINIKFYNIGESTRSLFTGKNNRVGFSFEAWYGDFDSQQFNKDFSQGSTTIFRGLTYTVNTYREGADTITEVVGCDMFLNLQIKQFNQPFPANTSYLAIVKTVIAFYNGMTTLNPISDQFLTGVYRAPKTIIGLVPTVLKKIAADADLIFSIQNNVVTMVPKNLDVGPVTSNPIYINNKNGLVGYVKATALSVQLFPVTYLQTPSLNNNLSLIQVSTLLRHYNMYDLISLESEYWNGNFRVLGITQTGEWRGNTWYSTLTLWPQINEKINGNSTT